MKKNVLIVGAGIAGLTLADLLEKGGWQVTVIEKAPALQTGGYMIDFFGPGYTVAERMGLLPALQKKHFPVAEMRFLNGRGRAVSTLSIEKLRAKAKYRHFNFLRGDLEEVLNELVSKHMPIHYGQSVVTLAQSDNAVDVTWSDGSMHAYDAVVGADGINSRVRELVFGPMAPFEHYLGLTAFAYIVPHVSRMEHVMYASVAPRILSSVYPIEGNRLATFFVFQAPKKLPFLSREEQRKLFHETFVHLPLPIAEAVTAFDTVSEIYFGPFSQIRMPGWHQGRVALVGDAAYCVSPVAGQGASLAMYGAYTLAQALKKDGVAVAEAFREYEAKARPEILSEQKKADRTARLFLPKTRLGAAIASRFAPIFLRGVFKSANDDTLF